MSNDNVVDLFPRKAGSQEVAGMVTIPAIDMRFLPGKVKIIRLACMPSRKGTLLNTSLFPKGDLQVPIPNVRFQRFESRVYITREGEKDTLLSQAWSLYLASIMLHLSQANVKVPFEVYVHKINDGKTIVPDTLIIDETYVDGLDAIFKS